jgi:Methyltransferase domain
MDIDNILTKLDDWVACHGNGCYWGDGELPPDPKRFSHVNENPIQQVRAEIHEFARMLHKRPKRHVVVEIGLGQYGGTRYLWQMLFERVITIEIDKHLVERVDYPSRPSDAFVIGNSLTSFDNVRSILNGRTIDCLFIDGDHSYEQAKAETFLYLPLVDGIIAWHDTCQHFGVERFVQEMSSIYDITTLDLAHTGKWHGHQMSPLGVKIGLSYCRIDQSK